MHACLSEKQKRESEVVLGPSIIIIIIKKEKPNGIVNSNCKEVTEALDCMGYQATGEIKKIKSFKSTDPDVFIGRAQIYGTANIFRPCWGARFRVLTTSLSSPVVHPMV